MAKMTFEQYAEMYSSYLEYLNGEEPEKKEPEKKEPEKKEPEKKDPEKKEPEKKEPEKKEPEKKDPKKEPEANTELIEAIKKLTEAMGKPRPKISEDNKVTIEDVIKKII